MLPRNQVYRAVEKTAHGLISLQKHDVVPSVVLGSITGILTHTVIGAAVGAVCLAGVLLGRRAWEDRRDYPLLLLRRLESARGASHLAPDRAYRPYPRGEP